MPVFARRTNWNLAPNALTQALDSYRRSGRELLDLTASNPTNVGLRYDAPALLAALASPQVLSYHPDPKGLLSARAAVTDYYATLAAGSSQPAISPEQIILTVSTSEAYSFVFRLLCEPDDEVLVPAPSYPLFEFLADLQDVHLVPYPLFYDHGWHIDLHSLEQALTTRSRAIILVHPNNPTGSYVKPHETAQLNALCAARSLALLVDEVFLDYALAPVPSPTVAVGEADGDGKADILSFACNCGALTFTLSGVSKISGLPQMKFAWIAVSGPEELARGALARLEIIADTYLSQNAPIQLAAPVLLQQRHSIRDQLLVRIRTNLGELDRQLAAQRSCSRLEVEGGWYAILRVPVTRSDELLCASLLESKGVLVQPGYFYDFHSDGYLVVSLIAPGPEFAEGLRRLLQFVAV